MSYDVRIWTVEQPQLGNTLSKLGFESADNAYILPLKKGQILISNHTPVEAEDIPDQISRELPGIRYLVEAYLEPITSEERPIKMIINTAKSIAKDWRGVVENPQTDEIILPSGIKRVLDYEKNELFTLMELSWWFNNEKILEIDHLRQLIDMIDRTIPEVLPRRYGLYEPPKEKYLDKESFIKYLSNNVKGSIVWYPTKPVDYVQLGIPEKIGPMRIGYRFGQLSISIDAAVIDMPGWSRSLNELFRGISQIINPFYGDIYFLINHVRSRTVSYLNRTSEIHPISAWWWNGVPRKLGVGLVIGEPLQEYVHIKSNFITLENGCWLILPDQDNVFRELTPREIEVNKGLLQPIEPENHMGNKLYPKIWPFSGPYAE